MQQVGDALYFNADYINTGALVVKSGSNTIFSAGYTGTGSNKIGSVQIGAFTINRYGLIGEFKDINDSNKTKYTGIRLRSDSGSNKVAFFAGGTDSAGTSAPFRVTNAGDIYASSGTIGGWTITSDHLYSSKGNTVYIGATADYTATTSSPIGKMNGATINNLVFRFGTNANATFGVGSDGKMYATAGNIAGWTINTNGFTYSTIGANGSFLLTPSGTYNSAAIAGGTGLTWAMTIGYTFGVTTGGALYATGANITGTITATAGTVGSATEKLVISGNDLYISASNNSYKSTTYFWYDPNKYLNVTKIDGSTGISDNAFYMGRSGLIFKNNQAFTATSMYDACRLTCNKLVFTGSGGVEPSYYGHSKVSFGAHGMICQGYEASSTSLINSADGTDLGQVSVRWYGSGSDGSPRL
jgi:hypothetical protein